MPIVNPVEIIDSIHKCLLFVFIWSNSSIIFVVHSFVHAFLYPFVHPFAHAFVHLFLICVYIKRLSSIYCNSKMSLSRLLNIFSLSCFSINIFLQNQLKDPHPPTLNPYLNPHPDARLHPSKEYTYPI